ncbi:hypothetical protein AaE_013194 [Aphanomyces astaci]|uniref:Tc1-like transposase DDE domain-containing protein n=1 Tax=Aphanomyces astaci TaxID=112090 RepID=A0A6A4Z4W0_APHAT|nr:hypothetical protein AaE_013194 [Aphanomyces astaci]
MPRGKNITEEEKGQIKAFLALKKSLRWIANAIGRSDKLVRTYVGQLRQPMTANRAGRRIKLTKREIRRVFRLATRKGMSSRQISAVLNGKVKHTTVLRVLQMSKFAKYIKRRSGPRLTPQHKKDRVEFAARYLNQLDVMKTTMFTDEKKFNLDGPDGCQYYWHDLREEVETYSKRVAGGGSVMVWGGMSFHNKSKLAFLEGRQDSAKYQDTLRGYLLPAMRALCGLTPNGEAIFQQDNASIHRSRSTMAWLEEMPWTTMTWPAKSPDLNPIENVWGVLARKVYAHGRQFDTKAQLKAQILQSWEEIDQKYLSHLVDGMPTRMAQVILRRGQCIDK